MRPLPSQDLTDAWVNVVRGPCVVSILQDHFDHSDTSKEFLLRPEKRQQLAQVRRLYRRVCVPLCVCLM